MNNWFESLVIILSVMLALFLLLSITLVVKFIQIIKQIKRITDHAEEAVDKAEQIADFFKSSSGPMAFVKILANVSESFKNASNRFGGNKKGKRQ